MASLSARGQTALLTLLVSIGAISVSIYTPSLPDLAVDLGSDAATAKLTISLFLAAFAVAQLVYGPLSDAYGRRPALLAGMVIYCLGSAACAVAPTIEFLTAARFIQALGACSGPVVARAVVRDLFGRDRSAAVMATISAALALAPAVGPIVGGLLHV
jgi:DHA1 family bicyclomycin/chloramphenicol resistance-like MFS transporter